MWDYEHWKKDPLSQKALARIAALENEVVKLEARCSNAAACLVHEADVLKAAAAEANRVSDPRPQ
jgi:hypothetical protein